MDRNTAIVGLIEICGVILVAAFIIKHSVLAALRTHSKERDRERDP